MGSDDRVERPVAPPPPPGPGQVTREAIQAQIESLPDILRAQQEFGPQFSQEQLDALRTFGPQFASVALDIQRQISPELRPAALTLERFLGQTDEEEFERLLPQVRRDVRAAQSQRGLGAISPLGSIEEATQIEQLRQNLKNRRLNIALSTAGRQPISGISPTTGVGQLVQNVNPQSIFARQSSIDQFNLGLFGQQAQLFQNQPGSIFGQLAGGLGGAAVGGLGASLGAGLGGALLGGGAAAGGGASAAMLAPLLLCHVAKEIYGSWGSIDTIKARYYVMYKAPQWFRNFYAKHGKQIADFISDKPILKKLIKPLFDWFGRRASSG